VCGFDTFLAIIAEFQTMLLTTALYFSQQITRHLMENSVAARVYALRNCSTPYLHDKLL